MICSQCGKELSEDASFCGACGAPVSHESGKTAAEEAHTEVLTPQAGEAVTESAPEADPQPEAQTLPPQAGEADITQPLPPLTPDLTPKKKKFPKFLIPVVVVVLAAVAGLALLLSNVSALKGTFIKTFGSDAAYFAYVETRSLDSCADTLTALYGSLLEASEATGVKEEVALELGDSAKKQLGALTGMPCDLSFLDKITLKIESNADGDKADISVKLMLNETELLDLSVIGDVKNQNAYLAALNLGKQYLLLEGEDLGLTEDEESEAIMDQAIKVRLAEILPEEKEVNRLLKKYVAIALEEMDTVEKKKTEVSVGELEQKLTEVTFSLNEEVVAKVATAVLEEAKTDPDLKKLIVDTVDSLREKLPAMAEDGQIPEGSEIYEEFVSGVDSLLDDAGDAEEEGFSEEVRLQIVDLVNSDHEIVGRTLIRDGEELIRYATVQKGKKTAFELVSEDMEIRGDGEKSGGKISGEFDLEVAGQTLLDFSLKDWDTDAMKKGELYGTVELTPTASLYSQAFGEEASILSMADLSLRLDFAGDGKKSEGSVCLLSKGQTYLTLNYTVSLGKNKSVSLPADSQTVKAEDADQWIKALDFDKLLDALEKEDVDPQLIRMLENLLGQMEV